MEEVYIETPNGKYPIEKNIIEKYNLTKGMLSPFSRYRLVDKTGDFSKPDTKDKGYIRYVPDEGKEDGLAELDNGILLSTSEMIDISQGADSYEEH